MVEENGTKVKRRPKKFDPELYKKSGVEALTRKLAERVKLGEIGEEWAGAELKALVGQAPVKIGAHWTFKGCARLYKVEPYVSSKFKKYKGEPEFDPFPVKDEFKFDFSKINEYNDRITQIKNFVENLSLKVNQKLDDFEAKINAFPGLLREFDAIKQNSELLMDAFDEIETHQGIYITHDEKNITVKIPGDLIKKESVRVEEEKLNLTGKKICLIGPEPNQTNEIKSRLNGANVICFDGKTSGEYSRVAEVAKSCDLTVVWPRFTRHWATHSIKDIPNKITMRSAGITSTVKKIRQFFGA